MTPSRRPRRALLFTPAVDRRKIEKAPSVGADAVILDLEDAVAPTRKAEGRKAARAALDEVDFLACERLVRVNAVGSGLEEEDVAVTAGAMRPPAGYVLPKVEASEQVRRVADLLTSIERERDLPEGSIGLLAIIETARGVVRLDEIATAHPRLSALVFGAEDLCGDVGATRSREGREVFYARSALVIHAAAARLQAIDTPFVDLGDDAGLLEDARFALDLGYSGKLAIHPKQVAPIVAVFTPGRDELLAAERLLGEHARHQGLGLGVFALDGRMVDMPMVRAAERVVARARAAGLRP